MFYKRHKARIVTTKADQTRGRIYTLMGFVFLMFLIIILRLFQLQVFQHNIYAQAALSQHLGSVELPAKRGDIYVKDAHSGELSRLATNTTLDLLYIDPNVEIDEKKDKITPQENKKLIAQKLPPIIFTKQEYETCKENPKECAYDITKEGIQGKKTSNEDKLSDEDLKREQEDYSFKDYEVVLEDIQAKILKDISKKYIDFVVLKRDAKPDLMEEVESEKLSGISVDKERLMISADPTLIPENELDDTAKILAKLLDQPAIELKSSLSQKKLRYVLIKNKLAPEVSSKINDLGFEVTTELGTKKMKLKGIVLTPEHWRFYPEGQLASNIVGYVDLNNSGQYGIEGYFNVELEGKKGSITSQSDPKGRQITVGETEIVNAVDGQNIVLTIDRVVQKKVEEVLAARVEEYKADSGQVIVMDPFSGAIIAMANYPTFDPNDYTEALKLRKYIPEEDAEAYKKMEIFKKDKQGKYVPIEKLKGDLEDSEIQKYVYVNRLGLGALKNKTVTEYYEPGSTFKPIVMAIGLDVGEVTPETTYNNSGPIALKDGGEIKNSTGIYGGRTTMITVLQKSLNTGMVFVANKLGAKVLYSYFKNFGFGEYSNIGLEGEIKADLEYYKKWDDVQLMTTGFGQGIVVTPLQLISAWSALANGGKLMQPYIVDSVIKEGKTTQTEPKIISRVISEETSSIITSMLISVVKTYNQKIFKIPGYQIAGKTGTAQIVGPGGSYEKGLDGTTITSFVGYAPALKPKFVILVKMDRPRIGAGTWGETTAGPVFSDIAKFILDYYNVEPES